MLTPLPLEASKVAVPLLLLMLNLPSLSTLKVLTSPVFLSLTVIVFLSSSLLTSSRSGLARTISSAAVMPGCFENLSTARLASMPMMPKAMPQRMMITTQPMPTQARGLMPFLAGTPGPGGTGWDVPFMWWCPFWP